MKVLILLLTLALSASCTESDNGAAANPPSAQVPDGGQENNGGQGNDDGAADDVEDKVMSNRITVKVGGREFAATLADTAAAREFAAMLPLTLDMAELNGNEKYATLPHSLTTSASTAGTIREGDIMLWQSDCAVLFYKTFSSGYSYTRLGSLDSPSGIADAVGRGSARVTFERAE